MSGPRSRATWQAASLYIVLTIALAWPWSVHPATRIISPGTDTDLFLWTLGWDVHAFLTHPFSIFDANIFFPFHDTLAYSENLIGSAIVAAPVVWISHNLVLAMNLVVLAATVLCALGGFVLARRLGLSDASAMLTGVMFGFSPPRFLRLDQIHLATIEWVPFGLACLHGYFDTGRAIDLRLAILCLSLQAITSGHGAAFLVLAMALLVAYRVARGVPIAWRRRVRDVGWSGGLLLLPALLIYWPYRVAQIEVGLRRPLEDWTISASSFISSGAIVQGWIVAHLPDWAWVRQEPDALIFPGILPIVLAVVAFLVRGRTATMARRPNWGWRVTASMLTVVTLVATAIAIATIGRGRVSVVVGGVVWLTARPWHAWTAAIIAAAARLALLGRAPFWIVTRWRLGASGGVEIGPDRVGPDRGRDARPYYALVLFVCLWLAIGPPWGLWRWVYWLPGLNFVRVPSRFMLLGTLAVAVLAGTGFERLTARVGDTRRRFAAAGVGVLLIVEFAAVPIVGTPYRIDPPAVDRWLATLPTPFSVVEVPLPDSTDLVRRERRDTLFMLHSTAHWQPIVEGYSGIQPPGYRAEYDRLTAFPDAASVAELVRQRVTYVVVHEDLYEPEERADLERRIASFSSWLTLAHTEGDGRVYRLHAPSASSDGGR